MSKNLNSLSATYLYQMYNKTLNLNNLILKMSSSESEVLSEDDLKFYIADFERRYNFPLKNKVLEDFRQGRVKLIYNEKQYKLPSTIPAYLMNNGQAIICCVNLSNHMRKNKNGEYIIDTKILYSYMQMGTILCLCFSKFNFIKNKVNLIKLGSYMYSKLFTKVMNKMFTLSITPAKTDAINFLSSLFFITNMMGRDEESIFEINKKYALDNCTKMNQLVINDYVSSFDIPDFKNLDTFLNAIKEKIPGMEDLNTRAFVDNYLMNYGPSMLFGIEYLPYFIGNLSYVEVGAMLNEQIKIENLLGTKDMNEFLRTLSTL